MDPLSLLSCAGTVSEHKILCKGYVYIEVYWPKEQFVLLTFTSNQTISKILEAYIFILLACKFMSTLILILKISQLFNIYNFSVCALTHIEIATSFSLIWILE